MILCIAEKPSVSRELAKVLAPEAKKNSDGFLEGREIVFAHARGHLCCLMTPGEMDSKYRRWSYSHLPLLPPVIPVQIREGCSREFNAIKKLLHDKRFTQVVCATDAGREGQYIFDLIYQLGGGSLPVQRLWLSAFTEEGIRKAWAAMRDISAYSGLSLAARLRSYADWYVGMNASPAVSLAAGPTINVGRVMTPTLKLIVDRTLENRNFIPETSYQIVCEFGSLYQGTLLKAGGDTLFAASDPAQAKALADSFLGKSGEISQVKKERQKETPPRLFNLGDLQVAAAKALGFTAQKTLETAQSLYETHKCLSYPRTNSRHIDDSMVPDLPGLVLAVGHLPGLAEICQGLLSKPLPKLGKNYVDTTKVTDHHCLLPTSHPAKWEKLSADEKALFSLVVKRFLAVFFPAAEYQKTTVLTWILPEREDVFRTTGRLLLLPGWKAVYGLEGGGEDEEEKSGSLPPLAKGQVRPVSSSSVEEKQTKAKPLYDDGTMIKAMQNVAQELEADVKARMKGLELGTEATRAAILEKLIQLKMVQRQGKGKTKNLVATDFGVDCIAAICEESVKSPMLTAEWEMKLAEIETGKLDEAAFMVSIQDYIRTLVEGLRKTTVRLSTPRKADGPRPEKKEDQVSLGKCPFCGGAVVENAKAYGCDNWKNGCKFTVWKSMSGRSMGPEIVAALLAAGRTELLTGFLSKAGKPFSASLVLREDKTVGFDFSPKTATPPGKSSGGAAKV